MAKKQGFFDLGTGIDPNKTGKTKVASKKIGCTACGLYHDCDHPKIEPRGEGKKKILFITEYPGEYEDQHGRVLSKEARNLLTRTLDEIDINLKEDCWIVHAVRCTPDEDIPTDNEIGYCRTKLLQTIEELNPKVIVPMGAVALKGLLHHRINGRLSGTSMESFFGETIPDQELEKWLCPTYSVEWLLQETVKQGKKNVIHPIYLRLWKKSVKGACKKIGGFFKHNLENDILTTTDVEEAKKWLRIALKSNKVHTFDYEATGLKPHMDGHSLTTCSWSAGVRGYACPYFEEDQEFCRLWYKFTRSLKVKKVAHNLSYENTWTKYKVAGKYVRGWEWDTCLAAHCINSFKPTGQKFYAYVLLGILNYDDSVDQYLKPSDEDRKKYGGNAINTIHQADLQKLLLYNGQDSLICYHIMEWQKTQLKGKYREGYLTFQKGSEVLSQVQNEGMLVNMDRLSKNKRYLTKKIDSLHDQLYAMPEIEKWDKRDPFNATSDQQLKHLLYDILKTKPPRKGNKYTDEKQLQTINTEFTNTLIPYKKLLKMRDTYLAQFEREQVNGVVRPFFNLNIPKTLRSCIAEGSPVLVNRDYGEYQMGVPIEQIKKGDFVYAFDDDLKLVLRKVLWSGKTGHRQVVRITYRGAAGRISHLDTTPEHRIRLINGEYVEAKNLLQDYRDRDDPNWKYQPKSRVLSCRRCDERLFPTNQEEVLEHRFVYEQRSGEKICKEDIIHHIDKNHSNNDFSNLQKMDLKTHSALHYGDTIGTVKSRAYNVEVVTRLHREGAYDHCYKKGLENPNCLGFTKEECISLLKEAGGRIKNVPHDFTSFKYNCELTGVNLKELKCLFTGPGKFIEKEDVLKHLREVGFSETQNRLHVGFAKLNKILEYYNIGYERGVNNQTGEVIKPIITVNNHIILSVEYLREKVDVYDLEIEGVHNFIVNEICVHNSSNAPNFQNFPARDPIALKYVMSNVVPHLGNKIGEYDYKGVEVATAVCVTNDRNLKRYVSDSKNDMHRDTIADALMMKPDDITKEQRFMGKSDFVFPGFYGMGPAKIASALWDHMSKDDRSHLYNNGVRTYKDFLRHIEEVYRIFWEERFPDYADWKKKCWKDYLKKGYVEYKTGFRYYGPAKFTQVTNAPIQGPAFHILLWTLANVYPIVKKEFDRSFIIGQIHDAIVVDMHPEDEPAIDALIKDYGTVKVREHWDWITLPFSIEKEATEVNASWNTMTGRGFI